MKKSDKQKQFILIVFLVSITRMGDGITTYFITPDLKYEKNPLVTVLDFNWTGLIIAGVLLVLFTAYLYHYYLYHDKQVKTSEDITSLKEYISYYYFEDKHSFTKLFYAFPKSKQALLASLGYVLAYSSIIYGAILTVNNTLVYYSDTYNYFVYHAWILMYLIIIPITIYFFFRFFKNKYKDFLSRSVSPTNLTPFA
jgi:hypothetical protein